MAVRRGAMHMVRMLDDLEMGRPTNLKGACH
jgi:hypothetical protein